MFISRLPSFGGSPFVGGLACTQYKPWTKISVSSKRSVLILWSGLFYTIILLSILYTNEGKAAWLFNIFKRTKLVSHTANYEICKEIRASIA